MTPWTAAIVLGFTMILVALAFVIDHETRWRR